TAQVGQGVDVRHPPGDPGLGGPGAGPPVGVERPEAPPRQRRGGAEVQQPQLLVPQPGPVSGQLRPSGVPPFDLAPSDGAEGVRSGSGAARPTGIVPPPRPPRPPPRAPAAPGRSPADSGQGGRARPGTVPPSSPLRAGRKALLRGRGARPAPAPREPGWHILPLVAG